MDNSIVKSGRAGWVLANLLLVSLINSPQSIAQDEQEPGPTLQELHALINELIVDKLILQNYWHKTDFPQYNHFDDAVWSVTKYSGDGCEITYQRKFEISHRAAENVKAIYGDKPATITGYKTAKFNLAQIDILEIRDYDDSRGSIPSIGIRFVGPTQEWSTAGKKPGKAYLDKDPIIKTENAISVLAKDSTRLLGLFQQLKELCPTVDDESS